MLAGNENSMSKVMSERVKFNAEDDTVVEKICDRELGWM